MAIFVYFQLRYNTGTNTLEMNTGNETWVTVDLTNNVTFPTPDPITVADIDSEDATEGQLITADGEGAATWEDPA